MTGPLAEYRRRVSHGELRHDPAQEAIAEAFERLHNDLIASPPAATGWSSIRDRLIGRKPPPVRGIYLWGSVGRGKTFLMDLFFTGLPFEQKLRQHFHRFMAGVHAGLKRHRNRREPLDLVADELAARTRIICFDEFAVSDIADAMILGNLFRALFERGVTLAATSNTEPKNLYKDGLQRQRFLPAIALLEEHTDVINMGGLLDYRLQFLQRSDLYRHPANAAATQALREFFVTIAPEAQETGGELDVLGRNISYLRDADGAIWFDFDAICDGPRSQDDYIELSRCYQTVVISNVPQFTRELENQARRFIALVDEFYDRRVKLAISAAVPIRSIYAGKKLKHEFERTRSRLQEMQSEAYLAAAHRP